MDILLRKYIATEHANFTIVTSENTAIPVYDAANMTRTEDHLVYAVDEEVIEASASGGSAWGGLDMLVGNLWFRLDKWGKNILVCFSIPTTKLSYHSLTLSLSLSQVGVHGLEPTEYYYVKFVETSTGEYVWTEKTLPVECGETLSESIPYCVPVVVSQVQQHL